MERFCKITRILTLAPLLAIFSLTAIALMKNGVFPTVWHYIYTVAFLGILPLLAYPAQKITPYFKDKGRSGQRLLAMIFAVAGYVLSVVVNIFTSCTADMWLISLEYLISGVLILFFNKVLKIKISAHGCGSAGPIFLLLYFGLIVPALIMGVITVLAYVSSIKAKHHTVPQLVGGSAVSILLLFCLSFVF